MSGDGTHKLRAIFLAALMFFWLFAGTVAFAGGAVAGDPDEVAEIEVDTAEDLIAAAAGNEVDGEVVEEDGTITVTEDIEVTDADDGDPNVQILVDGVTLTGTTDDVEISGLDEFQYLTKHHQLA